MSAIFTRDIAGLRGLNLERIAWTFVIVAIFSISSATAHTFLVHEPAGTFVELSILQLVRNASTFFPVMLAMTVADNLPLRGRARLAALAAALLAGVIAMHPMICLIAPRYGSCENFPSWQTLIRAAPEISFPLPWCAVIAVAYFSLRRDRQLAAALHAAEMERVDIERRTLESDLQAMQARVEPEFLMGTLREIATLCGASPQTAERVLEELVIYLRAALPDMRGTSSTLGREIELVRAWLAIVEIRTGGSLALSAAASPDLDLAIFPPMTLLPLLASLVGTDIQPRVRLRFAASRNADALRVRIAGASGGPGSSAADGGLRTTQERLRAIYGDDASVSVEAVAGQPEIVLQIPFELETRVA